MDFTSLLPSTAPTPTPNVVQVQFRNVKFWQVEANEEVGQRLVVHEYPQRNTPYVEFMGRKTRKYSVKAICAGDNWEQARDALKAAAELSTSGTLIHPSYGEMVVWCETCHVSNFYVNGVGKAEIDLTFVEQGLASSTAPTAVSSTKGAVQGAAATLQDKIRLGFSALTQLARLPQTAIDYLTNSIQDVLGVNPYQIMSTIDALQSLSQTDITSALFPSYITSYLQSFRGSFIDSVQNKSVPNLPSTITGGTTSINTSNFTQNFPYEDNKHITTITTDTGEVISVSITPTQIVQLHNDIIATALDIVNNNNLPTVTDNNKLLKTQLTHMYKFIAATCVIEQVVTCTYLSFSAVQEAEAVWTQVLGNIDSIIEISADNNDDATYEAMQDIKQLFVADIRARAPTLDKLTTKNIATPKPSLVVAYNLYSDISREQEIINRNKVTNPSFIVGSIEVLNV